ncbi:MAG: hypothetical protein KAJ98_08810, partial [Spirochaetaceae bacterium]|nr:hypothetical protein [Spirochaetaceae bacterium]
IIDDFQHDWCLFELILNPIAGHTTSENMIKAFQQTFHHYLIVQWELFYNWTQHNLVERKQFSAI